MDHLGSSAALAYALKAPVETPEQRLILLAFASSAGSDFEVEMDVERFRAKTLLDPQQSIQWCLDMMRIGVIEAANWDDSVNVGRLSVTFPKEAGHG